LKENSGFSGTQELIAIIAKSILTANNKASQKMNIEN